MATVVSPRAEGCPRTASGLRTSESGLGVQAMPGPVGLASGGDD
jgi:hypothetical protein